MSHDVYFYKDVFLLNNNEACRVEEIPSEGEHIVIENQVGPFENGDLIRNASNMS